MDWGVHCGAGHLIFAGRNWRAEQAPALPPRLPGPQGQGSGPAVLPGYAILTAADRLTFDAPGHLADPVALRPVADAPLCD